MHTRDRLCTQLQLHQYKHIRLHVSLHRGDQYPILGTISPQVCCYLTRHHMALQTHILRTEPSFLCLPLVCARSAVIAICGSHSRVPTTCKCAQYALWGVTWWCPARTPLKGELTGLYSGGLADWPDTELVFLPKSGGGLRGAWTRKVHCTETYVHVRLWNKSVW